MDSGPAVAYRIDREDRLAEVDAGWSAFAAANGGTALEPPRVLGRRLWEFLTDRTTIHLYEEMVRRVRRDARPLRFRFRCDAAGRRRLLAMEIAGAEGGGVWFRVTPVVEQPRPPVSLPAAEAAGDGDLVTMCSWCKKVLLDPDRWGEIEEAIEALDLFRGPRPPRVTHGMCPACEAAMARVLEDPAAGESGTITTGDLPAG